MSAPNGTDPPLPYLLSAESDGRVTSRNDWGLSVDEVSVFAEPQRFINLSARAGIVRSPFREGVMRCDEHGIQFSGRQNTPKKWLSEVSGVARVILFIGYVTNSASLLGLGIKSLVSMILLGVIFVSLLVIFTANFINGQFRDDVTFSVNWDTLRGLQLDRKLRFLTLIYEVPTPDSEGSVQHHLTLNRLQPATLAAIVDIIERFAPLTRSDKYKAPELRFKHWRKTVIIVLVMVAMVGVGYALLRGRVLP